MKSRKEDNLKKGKVITVNLPALVLEVVDKAVKEINEKTEETMSRSKLITIALMYYFNACQAQVKKNLEAQAKDQNN